MPRFNYKLSEPAVSQHKGSSFDMCAAEVGAVAMCLDYDAFSDTWLVLLLVVNLPAVPR